MLSTWEGKLDPWSLLSFPELQSWYCSVGWSGQGLPHSRQRLGQTENGADSWARRTARKETKLIPPRILSKPPATAWLGMFPALQKVQWPQVIPMGRHASREFCVFLPTSHVPPPAVTQGRQRPARLHQLWPCPGSITAVGPAWRTCSLAPYALKPLFTYLKWWGSKGGGGLPYAEGDGGEEPGGWVWAWGGSHSLAAAPGRPESWQNGRGPPPLVAWACAAGCPQWRRTWASEKMLGAEGRWSWDSSWAERLTRGESRGRGVGSRQCLRKACKEARVHGRPPPSEARVPAALSQAWPTPGAGEARRLSPG